MNRKAFTLVELMVVVIIIIIIAAAALTGSSKFLKNLRFSNNFNQMVFMVQEARNLASTGKDKTSVSYSVKFDFSAVPSRADVYKTKINSDIENVESYVVPSTLQIFSPLAAACGNSAIITFANLTGDTQILCDGTPPQPQSSIIIGVRETQAGGSSKTFSIHQAAGIPQVIN